MTRLSSAMSKPSHPADRLRRPGSALVLCFLAMAVISMAAISLARSHRRINVRRSAISDRAQGLAIANGLIHREIAFRRNPANQSISGSGTFIGSTPTDEEIELEAFENATTQIDVLDDTNMTLSLSVRLYENATMPAIQRARVGYASN